MKFINLILIHCLVILSSCCKKDRQVMPEDVLPEYKLIDTFSKKIKTETNLILRAYGINMDLPKGYFHKNGTANFYVSYRLCKAKQDEISLEQARNLTVFLTEKLLQEINSTLEVRPSLDTYPFVSDLIKVVLYFEDEKQIDLGQGVAVVYFLKGKIKYEGYKIYEYRETYPARGKHFVIHEETYAEALDIVKKQGALAHL